MDWRHQTVVVTGAGGFIGSHLTERLVALGARTRAFIRYGSANSWGWLDHSTVRNDVEVILGDIRDRDTMRKAVHQADIVFHLAALIGIPYSYIAPQSYIDTNILGTLNVLQASLEAGVKRVLHTSTSEVYGTARYVPIDEKHPLQGQSPYAASKIGADKMVEAFHYSFGLPVVTLRPFNTFGPRQSARAVIPTTITQCLTDRVVRLGNTAPRRDMNYVSNTVDGYVKAAEAPEAIGRTFNLGSGREVSIGELAHLIARLVGTSIDVMQDAQRVRPEQSEVDRLLADNTAAKEILGWEPVCSLEEGLGQTIDWMREHLENYRPGVYVV